MMTDPENEDRTEAPTPRRLREARQKGQVAVSRDLAAAVALLAAAGGLHLFGPGLLGGLRAGLERSLSGLHEMGADHATSAAMSSGAGVLGVAAPFLILAMAAGIAATLAQVGFLFTGETLQLRAERLDPMNGFRRAFSMPTFVALAGGLAKGGVIVVVLAASLWQERVALAGLSARPLPEALSVLSGSAAALFWKSAIALLALGLVDWSYRRWQHGRDLRMSRREIRDELKEFDGDPAIRDRRRAHHDRLEEDRQVAKVSAADVVVTDAGDLAVALGMAEEAPLVLAKGKGGVADRIREAALAHGVPVVEKPDLARALHRGGVSAGLRTDAADAVTLGREMKGIGRHDD